MFSKQIVLKSGKEISILFKVNNFLKVSCTIQDVSSNLHLFQDEPVIIRAKNPVVKLEEADLFKTVQTMIAYMAGRCQDYDDLKKFLRQKIAI